MKELETQGIEDQKKIAAITAEKSYIENLNKQYLDILQNRNPDSKPSCGPRVPPWKSWSKASNLSLPASNTF